MVTPPKIGKPWLSAGLIRWLEKHLRQPMHVFEYGSGYSTPFLERLATSLVSVEHDIRWYKKIKPLLTSTEYKLLHPEEYPEHILEHKRHFDIILIDGIYRQRCMEAALKKVKKGGYIILDDSDKSKYAPIKKMMEGHEASVFKGEKESIVWKIV